MGTSMNGANIIAVNSDEYVGYFLLANHHHHHHHHN